jgi:hypothetical protein
MKKAQCGIVALAFALVWFLVPAHAAQAASRSSSASAGQQQQDGAQHLGLVLGGKVFVRHGHYLFYNTDTHSTFRIQNPVKAKRFKGDTVRIQGRVNAQRHTIYIYKITSYI